MVIRNKKEKIPRFIMIPWEGKEYRFIIKEAYNPQSGKDMLIAAGASTYPLHQHGEKWRLTIKVAADDMKRLQELIMCGFENQRQDQERYELDRKEGRMLCPQCLADPIL